MKLSVSILGIKENIKENIIKLDNSEMNYFHLDIMDGKFVENKTMNYKELANLMQDTKKEKDIHLMVNNVKGYIRQYKKLNPTYITFHIEATKNPIKIIKYLHKNNIKAGISIKPNTRIEELKDILSEIDLILVMSVEPGRGGQKFIESSTNRINELNEIRNKNNYKYLIEVDGGINNDTIGKCTNADIVVVGSYITGNNDYTSQIKNIIK